MKKPIKLSFYTDEKGRPHPLGGLLIGHSKREGWIDGYFVTEKPQEVPEYSVIRYAKKDKIKGPINGEFHVLETDYCPVCLLDYGKDSKAKRILQAFMLYTDEDFEAIAEQLLCEEITK